MGQLDGRTAIVTGAAQGLGRAIVEAFVREGGSVVATDIQPAGREALGPLGPAVHFLLHDVSDAEAWTRVVDAALSWTGRIDCLVNNAGVFALKSIQEVDAAEFERHWRINELGVFLGMKAVIGAMTATGGGSIVNMSSAGGFRGIANCLAYSTTKWAVRGLTKAASQDLAAHNIRVNAILPAGIATEMRRSFLDQNPEAAVATQSPLKRHGEPREVAEMAVFLASDASSFVTGADFVIDGGRYV